MAFGIWARQRFGDLPSKAIIGEIIGSAVTGATDAFYLRKSGAKHTVDIDFVDANGSITVLTATLEALAGTNWRILATHYFTASELASKGCMFHVIDKPAYAIRVNITVITGADVNDIITIRYIPGEE